jgi:hypothetical protein
MSNLLIKIFLVVLLIPGRLTEDFSADYHKYALSKVRNQESKKAIDRSINNLKSIFDIIRKVKGINLNNVDTLYLMRFTSVESRSESRIYLWNRTNQFYYEETLGDHGLEVKLLPPPRLEAPEGYYYFDETDSLRKLLQDEKLETMRLLAKKHPVLDGESSYGLVAKKVKNGYSFTNISLPALGLLAELRRHRKN